MSSIREKPKLCVLLAVFNGERHLSEQIDSILAQNGVEVSLVISLDDCSDNSPRICAEYADVDSRVSILPRDGRFGNAAYNFFYLMHFTLFLDADYVALSDQDDIWLPDKLARAARQLVNAGADGYSSNLTAFDEVNNKRWTIHKPGPAHKFDYLFQGASAGCTYVFSRKAANLIASRMRAKDTKAMTRPSHDWTFYAICRSYGLKWYFDDNYSGILYRQHENNFYGASGGRLQEVLKKWRILRSGWFREQVLYNSEFILGGPEENAVLSAMRRRKLSDRLWLIARISQFRRERSKRLGLAILLLLALY